MAPVPQTPEWAVAATWSWEGFEETMCSPFQIPGTWPIRCRRGRACTWRNCARAACRESQHAPGRCRPESPARARTTVQQECDHRVGSRLDQERQSDQDRRHLRSGERPDRCSAGYYRIGLRRAPAAARRFMSNDSRRRRVCREHIPSPRAVQRVYSLLFRGGDLDVVRHADHAVRVFRQPLGLGLGLLVRDRPLQVNDAVLRVDVDRHQILDPVRRQLRLHLSS
jgi:hypothetical protein